MAPKVGEPTPLSLYLDTHIALWLYAGEVDRLTRRAARAIETQPLLVCPMVVLELKYLFEIGRVATLPHVILADLKRSLGLIVRSRSLDDVVEQAVHLDWTRDAFDRMIVAQAALEDASLVSSDRAVRKHYPKAVW